jgi:hypothetical protein
MHQGDDVLEFPTLHSPEYNEDDWIESLDGNGSACAHSSIESSDAMSDDSGWDSNEQTDQELTTQEISVILEEWHNDALETEPNMQRMSVISALLVG